MILNAELMRAGPKNGIGSRPGISHSLSYICTYSDGMGGILFVYIEHKTGVLLDFKKQMDVKQSSG